MKAPADCSARGRSPLTRRVDHDAGPEFVVLPQVAVDVMHQHQHDDRAPAGKRQTCNPL